MEQPEMVVSTKGSLVIFSHCHHRDVRPWKGCEGDQG